MNEERAAETPLSSAGAAELQPGEWNGWSTYVLRNRNIEVHVAPALGGRIIQYSLAGHSFLWWNPDLAGQTPPPSGLGPNKTWLNWGGDKLWPAPQGWDSPAQWPGPPDPVLDGSPHSAEVLQESGKAVSISVTSPPDPYTGIQFSRRIRVDDGSSRVRVEATMTNRDTKPRRWGIWTVTQVDARRAAAPGFNPKLRVHVPAPSGYTVIYGSPDNPQFRLGADSILSVEYRRRVGKVGVKSPAGWVATVDGDSGFAFIQRFTFHAGREYPDGASVEVWTSGPGRIKAGDREMELKDDVAETPHLVESELLSPFAELAPGQSYTFPYEWYAANLGGDFPVRACNDAACVGEPMRLDTTGRGAGLTGRFGVLNAGFAQLAFMDRNGRLQPGAAAVEVSPAEPLVLESSALRAAPIPAGARRAVLSFLDPARRPIADFGLDLP